MHQATAIQGFKGARPGDWVFFFPIEYVIGSEDFVFLQQATGIGNDGKPYPARLQIPPSTGRSRSKNMRIFSIYKAEFKFTVMQVEYVCVFEKGPSPPCDYGIKVDTRHVTLPDNLKTYLPEPKESLDGEMRWIRRDSLISILHDLAAAKQILRPDPPEVYASVDGKRGFR